MDKEVDEEVDQKVDKELDEELDGKMSNVLQQQLEMEIPFQPTAGSQLDWWIMKPRGGGGSGRGGGRGGGQGGGRGDERGGAAENGDSFSNRQSQLGADNETCSTSVEAPATQIQPSSSSLPPRSVSNKQWASGGEAEKPLLKLGKYWGKVIRGTILCSLHLIIGLWDSDQHSFFGSACGKFHHKDINECSVSLGKASLKASPQL